MSKKFESSTALLTMSYLKLYLLILFVAPVWSSNNGLPRGGRRSKSGSLLERHGYTKFDGWSPWSKWSPCSRSCDGGATFQSRKCLFSSGCSGVSMQYKICNIEPCMEKSNFRDDQCASFNKDLYDGQFHEWRGVHDSEQPCTLICKSNITGATVNFSTKVKDGTRCRHGSLDMCVSGNCLSAGCDLSLGSNRRIDECGICGGDGSTCRHSPYFWKITDLSPCTVSCGGGFQISKPLCRNRDTGEDADEWYCDVSTRPPPVVRECNIIPCPSVWQTESWSECSASCGTGIQMRPIYCIEGRKNGTQVRLDDRRCSAEKPKTERVCNIFKCPEWIEGPWSECSATCGRGYKTRSVVCQKSDGFQSQGCNQKLKPAKHEWCQNVDCKSYSKDKGSSVKLPRPLHQNSASNKPRYVTSEWGPCSATCGWGERLREVRCKVYIEFSGEVVLSEDDCRDKEKPPKVERCFLKPCLNLGESNSLETDSDDTDVKSHHKGYSWRNSGYTECSASCLGGVRESITECIRIKDDAVVNPHMCDLSTKPDQLIQTCKNRPCPPRWNISDFSPCSKNCGGGKQQRTVHCIHEITRGNILSVADRLCPQPKPRTEKLCGLVACPTKWKASPWSQCSKTCGGGVKTREVKCQRKLAYGQEVEQPSAKCRRRKPRTVKPCKTKKCPRKSRRKSPKIVSDVNQAFVQTKMKKKVSLKVGGKATVYRGVNLKLKCRVKGRFDRAKLEWIKDRKYVKAEKRFSVSKNGALRIKSITYDDSGFYMCRAHKTQANITVIVTPPPDQTDAFYNSVEDNDRPSKKKSPNRHRSKKRRKNRRRKKKKKSKPTITEDEDFSHEDISRRITKVTETKKEVKVAGNSSRAKEVKVVKSKISPEVKQDKWKYNRGEKGKKRIDEHLSVESHEIRGPESKWRNPEKKYVYGENKRDGLPEQFFGESHELNGRRDDWDLNRGNSKPIYGLINGESKGESKYSIKDIINRFKGSPPQADRVNMFDDSSHEEYLSPAEKLDEEPRINSNYKWKIGHWSKCSSTCGQIGQKMRTNYCFIKIGNTTRNVDQKLCVQSGLPAPITVKTCGSAECPRWNTGAWSKCSRSRCVSENTAIMRRRIYCKFSNGTIVSNSMCNRKNKPRLKRECYTSLCKGTWKVGSWSECPKTCQRTQPYRRRLLLCVWYNTNKPAGNACNSVTRPQVVKLCKNTKCANKPVCADRTRYCSLANPLKMCRMYYFRIKCCLSCSSPWKSQQYQKSNKLSR